MLGTLLNDIKNNKTITTKEPLKEQIIDTGVPIVEWASKSLGENEKVLPMTTNTYLRASGLGYICPREEVLASRYNITRSKLWDTNQKWTVAIGTGVHWAFQNVILGPRQMISGIWRCLVCNHMHGSLENPILIPDSCDACNHKVGSMVCMSCKTVCTRHRLSSVPVSNSNKMCLHCKDGEVAAHGFEYVEAYLIDHDMLIHGHPDGFHPNGYDMWEFKTANSWAMKSFKQGTIYPGYILQAQFYLHATGRKRMRFVFFDKGDNNVKTGWHEHIEVKSHQKIDGLKSSISSLREGLNGGKLPERLCANTSCTKAKDCELVNICFSA